MYKFEKSAYKYTTSWKERESGSWLLHYVEMLRSRARKITFNPNTQRYLILTFYFFRIFSIYTAFI